MSLSTSSFKSELKVVALVLVVLLGCEAIIRSRENTLSLDLKHINQIPVISQSLAAADGRKILFLGNSLTRNGVDPDVLSSKFAEQGLSNTHFAKVFPDGTGMTAWYYVFNHYFVVPNRVPDVVVIGFAGAVLQDSHRVDVGELGRYFTSDRDIPYVFGSDLKTFDERTEFIASRISAAFSNRNRVRLRALDFLIPNYRESERWLNRGLQARSQTKQRTQATYNKLKEFLSLSQSHNAEVIFVAMPQREPYSVDPELQKLISVNPATFIDLRNVDGLKGTDYLDEMHLNDRGAETFSTQLAQRLIQRLQDSPVGYLRQK